MGTTQGRVRHTAPAGAHTPDASFDRPAGMTIDAYSDPLGGWARLEPPTAERPYWHDVEDPTSRYDLATALTATNPGAASAICDAHLASIGALLRAAAAMHPVDDFQNARRLAFAAGRLCTEVVGFRIDHRPHP